MRMLQAFFITLLLYAALLLLIIVQQKPQKLPPQSRVSLSKIKIIQPPTPKTTPAPVKQKPIPKQELKPSPHPKPKPSPKPKPKPKLYPKPKLKTKLAQKPKPKLKPHPKPKKPQPQTHYATKKSPPKKVQSIRSDRNTTLPSLNQLFAKTKKSPPKKALAALPPDLQKLYKADFSTFTKEQQKFIQDNLWRIAKITQKYLYLRGYPYIAIKTRQEGINAVEFTLHPNGDITSLRLLTSSGYEALDKNSIETIKTAYKDYPRPKEPTKIRINVHYSIIY